MIWSVRLCLTAVVFFVMVGYSKKVVDTTDTPILNIERSTLSFLVSSKAIILYVNKHISISIHTPWHLKMLWHPYKGVHGFVKGTQGISWWTYSYNLLQMNTIIVYYLIISIIINYHQLSSATSIILSWWVGATNLMLYALRSL